VINWLTEVLELSAEYHHTQFKMIVQSEKNTIKQLAGYQSNRTCGSIHMNKMRYIFFPTNVILSFLKVSNKNWIIATEERHPLSRISLLHILGFKLQLNICHYIE
jgi:hypothetical protein